MLDVNFFDELRIGLATADQIRAWSNGEVKKPETINYRTLKPEKDGLFCERIFGPTRDWECHCGKYKRVRFKGIICERCGVEITRSKVRRDRMGHIELAAPVTHIWYFKGVPSRLGYLLDLAPKDLERIIYFAAYVITRVDEDRRHKALPEIEAEMEAEKRDIDTERDDDVKKRLGELEDRLKELEAEGAKGAQLSAAKREAQRDVERIHEAAGRDSQHLDDVLTAFKGLRVKQLVADDNVYRSLRERFSDYFDGGMGAESIKRLLADMDTEVEAESLRDQIENGKGTRRLKAIKRLKVASNFAEGKSNPLGMVLDAIPVIPPDLRPMVQLDGGRFATSDLNDLYRRVINRNNRLKRLLDLQAPEIIVNNEKRMLQEAVDALFDNGRRGRPVTGPGNRPLKSLSDMLKGKQGRFRQNLLGKRVDYSGRSVIVVGPELRLHQCGLPKQMALELFKPFVMKRLVDQALAQNIKSAKRMVERARPQVWDVLEEVIREHPVLLNRAPTLHRLGIQAFEPVLVEGKAIKIHPLVCTAFNADFDGDQMAVHVPLSAEAQAEARILMLSTNNILSPAHGRPIATPTQDMVLGLYYLSLAQNEDRKDEDTPAFGSVSEALLALDRGHSLHDPIRIRLEGKTLPAEMLPEGYDPAAEGWKDRAPVVRTTIGRAMLNAAFPDDFEFRNQPVLKGDVARLVDEVVHRYDRAQVEQVLDDLKNLGFHYATRAGVTIGIEDVTTPPTKAAILDDHEKRAQKVEQQYRRGIITDDERRQELIEIWTQATDEVKEAMEAQFTPDEPHLHDGELRRTGEHHADPSARRDAWARGQPEGRDHPQADQVQLPRRPVRPRVLHLDPRRPQGSRRHGAADGRLRLPDPPAGGRRSGGDRPRGGLWDRSLHPRGRERSSTRRHHHEARSRRHVAVRPRPGRGRQGRWEEDREGRRTADGRDRPGRRRLRRPRGPRSVGHLVRGGGRCLRRMLRTLTRLRPLGGHRRSRRHHRRPVDRRAGDTAHHADVPHRRSRRGGHHPRPAPRPGALRGAQAQGRGADHGACR